MPSPSVVYSILVQWAAQSPALVVYLLGIVLALTYAQHHRTSAVLTLCAMLVLGALTLALPAAAINLYRFQSEFHWTIKQLGYVSLAISVTSATGHAVGVGLLLAAVFQRRAAPAINVPSNFPPPPPYL